MGSCASFDDTRHNKITRELDAAKIKSKDNIRILLLGPKGSGKNTFIKQMNYIHSDWYSEKERQSFIPHIHRQIISNMKTLLLKCDTTQLSIKAQEAVKNIMKIQDYTSSLSKYTTFIELLWKEPTIKAIFHRYKHDLIISSSEYFWNEIERISHTDYHPTDQDIILVKDKAKYNKISEQNYTIHNLHFVLINPCAQNADWRKYKNVFARNLYGSWYRPFLLTIIIFIASLISYDTTNDYEKALALVCGYIDMYYDVDDIPYDLVSLIARFYDLPSNGMKEQLDMFDDICNDPLFRYADIVIFLNKTDILKEKLKMESVNGYPCFEEFQGNGQCFDDVCNYISGLFEACNYSHSIDRYVSVHRTCMTDRYNVEKVFNDIQCIPPRGNNLMMGGLI